MAPKHRTTSFALWAFQTQSCSTEPHLPHRPFRAYVYWSKYRNCLSKIKAETVITRPLLQSSRLCDRISSEAITELRNSDSLWITVSVGKINSSIGPRGLTKVGPARVGMKDVAPRRRWETALMNEAKPKERPQASHMWFI